MVKRYKIDDYFKKRLKGVEVTPPPHIWENINAQLGYEVAFKRKAIMWAAAASIAVIFAFLAGFFASSFIHEEKLTTNNRNTLTQPTLKKSVQEIDLPDAQIPENAKVKSNASGIIQSNATNIKASVVNPPQQVIAFNTERQNPVIEKMNFIPSRRINIQLSGKYYLTYAAPILNPDVHQILTNKEDKDRWKILSTVSPALSYRFSQAYSPLDNAEASLVTTSDNYSPSLVQNKEYPILAYNSNTHVSYALTSKLNLRSGFTYSVKGIRTADIFYNTTNKRNSVGFSIINSTAGPVISKKNTEQNIQELIKTRSSVLGVENDGALFYYSSYTLEQRFSYIEVPFILEYTFLDKKIDLSVNGGIIPAIMIGNNAYLRDETQKIPIGYTQGMSTVSTEIALGFSTEVQLLKNLYWIANPLFKSFLKSPNNQSGYGSLPYSVEIATGLVFSF